MTASFTVGQIENQLFSKFPIEDAESWDQPGLAVGSRTQEVGRIAVGLDMSVHNVINADAAGCNLLVTHHPAYIKNGPDEFGPATQAATPGPGRMVYEAARRGVSAIAMHTNVDRAIETRERFADLMGCICQGNCEYMFDPSRSPQDKGFGALLMPDWGKQPTLARIVELCARSFSCAPRVWGDPDRDIKRIAFLNGSWNEPDQYERCIATGIECMIVGETRYHTCVDAQPFLSIVDLGHDNSELPIVDVLIDALVSIGVSRDDIVDLRPEREGWWTA